MWRCGTWLWWHHCSFRRHTVCLLVYIILHDYVYIIYCIYVEVGCVKFVVKPLFIWRGNCFSSCVDHFHVYVYIIYCIYVKVWCLKFVVTLWFIWRAHCWTTWCAHLAQKGVLNCSISDHEDCSRLYSHSTCAYTIDCLCGFLCVSVVVGRCVYFAYSFYDICVMRMCVCLHNCTSLSACAHVWPICACVRLYNCTSMCAYICTMYICMCAYARPSWWIKQRRFCSCKWTAAALAEGLSQCNHVVLKI